MAWAGSCWDTIRNSSNLTGEILPRRSRCGDREGRASSACRLSRRRTAGLPPREPNRRGMDPERGGESKFLRGHDRKSEVHLRPSGRASIITDRKVFGGCASASSEERYGANLGADRRNIDLAGSAGSTRRRSIAAAMAGSSRHRVVMAAVFHRRRSFRSVRHMRPVDRRNHRDRKRRGRRSGQAAPHRRRAAAARNRPDRRIVRPSGGREPRRSRRPGSTGSAGRPAELYRSGCARPLRR